MNKVLVASVAIAALLVSTPVRVQADRSLSTKMRQSCSEFSEVRPVS